MIEIAGDIAIIGAGFGGSLTALLAQRCGLRAVLIERGRHPRFALGESSTPVANLVLQSLAERYDLPRLRPLAKYGAWLRAYPGVPRGLKRGFSYFQHRAGEPFAPRADRSTELLVAANPDTEHGDTHWLRADFDQFLVEEARAAGVPYLDQTELTSVEVGRPWRLTGHRDGEPVRLTAEFLLDASGDGGALARALDIPNELAAVQTHSRALYAHFRDVRLWHDVYTERGGSARAHPFPCDAAALHHVFDGGWMWVLRFDNGVTSAGFSLDTQRYPLDERVSAADEWAAWLRKFPSIAEQFERAALLLPLRRTGRLQRRRARVAGSNWAMLPTTAGIIDALHSTGNAHTLTGIERLIEILTQTSPGAERTGRLNQYERAVLSEIDLIDALVHGCYQTFAQFDLMVSFAMLYFAAATGSEQQRRDGAHGATAGFLLSGDAHFRATVARCHARVEALARRTPPPNEAAEFASQIERGLRAYNIAGLCDPAKRNMYPFACAPNRHGAATADTDPIRHNC